MSIVASLIEISELKLKLHKDTDSPFAIRQDANDNWQEIMDHSVEVKTALETIEAGMGEITPETIKEMIRELLVQSKLTYIISKDMISGESIEFSDGTVLVRSNNTYTFSIVNADKRIPLLTDMSDFSELHPVLTATATELKFYFDLPITNNVRVLIM